MHFLEKEYLSFLAAAGRKNKTILRYVSAVYSFLAIALF